MGDFLNHVLSVDDVGMQVTGTVCVMSLTLYLTVLMMRRIWHHRLGMVEHVAGSIVRHEICKLFDVMLVRLEETTGDIVHMSSQNDTWETQASFCSPPVSMLTSGSMASASVPRYRPPALHGGGLAAMRLRREPPRPVAPPSSERAGAAVAPPPDEDGGTPEPDPGASADAPIIITRSPSSSSRTHTTGIDCPPNTLGCGVSPRHGGRGPTGYGLRRSSSPTDVPPGPLSFSSVASYFPGMAERRESSTVRTWGAAAPPGVEAGGGWHRLLRRDVRNFVNLEDTTLITEQEREGVIARSVARLHRRCWLVRRDVGTMLVTRAFDTQYHAFRHRLLAEFLGFAITIHRIRH